MHRGKLDGIFNPQSVAIIGASAKLIPQVGGASFLNNLLDYGFKGKIYPVNHRGGEISGLKAYPSVKDIPEPVDYVICCVSAPQVPQIIEDCIAKKVGAVHVYTGGFSESGTEEGRQLEKEIWSLAHQNNTRIVGPNCIGVYCPKAGLSFSPDLPRESGATGVICQSGGNSIYIVREGARRGIRFSKVISYGNACDVDECDLLQYLAQDLDTMIILAYIEGVKDGQRFHRVLKETAKAKPVIVLKGGVTESGERAAASHTGSLAGSSEVWDGLLHQAGAIRVHSLEELIDMAVTFTYLPLPSGKRAAVLGIGGGAAVLATDDCTDAGLEMPRLPAEVQDRLRSYLKKGGTGVGLSNPIDLSDQGFEGIFYNCARALVENNGTDLLIAHIPAGIFMKIKVDWHPYILSIVEDAIKAHKESSKPMAVAIHSTNSGNSYQLALDCERKCCEAGLPVYHSLTNAAKAIARFIDYHERRNYIS